MDWARGFHSLVIPFLGGFALTLAKLIADQRTLSFDEANGIALDMVLLGVGALGAFYIKSGATEATIDAGIGDAFLATILLYLRYRRRKTAGRKRRPVVPVIGLAELFIGFLALVWTTFAF